MARSSSIRIEILGWKKFNPRTDVKQPSWFRLENGLVDDPDFYDFSGDEFKAWIYILSRASKKNTDTIVVVFAHAEKVANIPRAAMESAIRKLSDPDRFDNGDPKIQILSKINTDSLRVRNAHDTSLHATERDETERDGTGRDETEQKTAGAEGPHAESLCEIWNDHCGSLPRVQKLTVKRKAAALARLRDNPDLEYWIDVVKRLAQSNFCNGEKGWRADFDFLLQPDTHVKAVEGKYDNRKGAGIGSKAQQTTGNLMDLWQDADRREKVGGGI